MDRRDRPEEKPEAREERLERPEADYAETRAASDVAPAEARNADESAGRALRPATLGEVTGEGIVTVIRGAEGGLVEANGTFQPEGHLTKDDLEGIFRIGSSTRYQGVLIDVQPRGETVHEVEIEVTISSIEDYQDLEGARQLLVNFIGQGVS
jgi:hypothetical protein